MSQISEEKIYAVLGFVEDPELMVDVVNLGLIYGVQIREKTVIIEMTLTAVGCPAAELLEHHVRKAVASIEGVEKVEIQWTFDPPWTPDRMTEEGRDLLPAQGLW